MSKDFIPSQEAELVTWSTNFDAQINNDPPAVGLTVEQTGGYSTLQAAFVAAFQASQDPSTRTPSTIVTKNEAKDALVANARHLARIIQACPTVSDTQRSDLGLTVRKTEPSPVPVPEEEPHLDIQERFGSVVRIRLHDDTASRRGKPEGVEGAMVFSFVGPTPPTDLEKWSFEGNMTRALVDVAFDPALAAGTQVWLTAAWYNPRGQSGPGCTPVSTTLVGGAITQAA